MVFGNFLFEGEENLGILVNKKEKVVLIREIFSVLDMTYPRDMNELIEVMNDCLLNKIEELLKRHDFKYIGIDKLKILSPIPYPKRDIICLGKNYFEHMKELDFDNQVKSREDVEYPIYFSKSAYPTIGQDDYICIEKQVTNTVDYEVELAIIIGKSGKNISKEDARKHIFGYTIANDVSARDIQSRHKQWYKGKSLDTFSPLGPHIVYENEIEYPVELNIESRVNGELRQNSNTSNMMFDIDYIISDLSMGRTLIPGDIIITGTPSGVGMGFNPPKYLENGDIVECTIEKIGTLRNIVKYE